MDVEPALLEMKTKKKLSPPLLSFALSLDLACTLVTPSIRL